MARITYWDLKANEPLSKGDCLLIYGIDYSIAGTNWFLNNRRGDNSAIFRMFGMSASEKMSWAKKFAKRGEVYDGDFPEFSNQQDFIDFIIAIYEKPLINKGDTIRVRERDGGEDDYPYVWVDGMLAYKGLTVKITNIFPASRWQCENKKCFNGDIYYYEIEGSSYEWHSSMFELSSLNKSISQEVASIKIDSAMGRLVEDRPEVISFDLYSKTKEESISPKKEVSSEGIILNKPKKHFQTKIVL